MKNTEVFFESPWLLLLLIPAVGLVLVSYRFMRNNAVNKTADRIAMILKVIEVILITVIISGLGVVTNSSDTSMIIVADRSDSMQSVR
ncbi:MAG: hypothetical protein Q4D04_01560, partial [Clostridia bacterium]|nr:hypothetical protein [Clostridia bacterium]